jgi:hypothetical protein
MPAAARWRSAGTSCCAWCARSPRPKNGSPSYFTDLPRPILEAACARYKSLGIWNETPVLPRVSYDRLRDSLVSGGFVSPGTPFETAVDNSLAEEVLKAR